MKTSGLNGGWRQWAVGMTAAGLVACASAAGADEPGPEQLRDQMRKLEQKAHELKAAGQEDQAQAVGREMQELREKAARMSREHRGENPGGDERRAALQRKLEHARAELKEALEAGQEARVADLERGIRQLEQELAPPGQPAGRERGAMQQPEQITLEQRIRHIREAVEHLHAAGLDDPAQSLAHEADRMQQQMGNPPHAPQGGPEVERLQAEIQELRQAVRKLNARLDGQNRDQR